MNDPSMNDSSIIPPELKPPYTNYTPLPGVVPPTQAPYFTSQGWCNPTSKCVVTASQPIIPVPVTQEIRRKEKIIEVDQTIITDNVVPKVYHQQVFYEVPKLDLDIRERKLNVPQVEIVEEVKEINCAVGFNFKLQPVWEVREVPRLIPKYIGHQEIVEVGVPQVQVIDKKIENEVPIYVGEKIVETEVYEEEGVELVKYEYKAKDEEVTVHRVRPVLDVEVAIPPPIVVPVPVAPTEKAMEIEHMTWDQYKKEQRAKACIRKCMQPPCLQPTFQQNGSPPTSPPIAPHMTAHYM